jgi:hypothetical protein
MFGEKASLRYYGALVRKWSEAHPIPLALSDALLQLRNDLPGAPHLLEE